ncbi:unnamed protein product [Closterium sp. NIES-53]
MEVARTSMIHAAAPHFLWPFAVWYAVHQLNLWPRVSLLETLPTLRWTGKVGDASVFRVWGSRTFVRNTSADTLSSRAIPCVFLGFPPDAPGWQFYHPTSRRVLPSQDVTFDESVPFYRPAPSGVSQVDPFPGTVPVKVVVDSGAARGAACGGATSGGAEPASAELGGAVSGGAESGGAEPGGAEPGGPAGASARLSPRREPLSLHQLSKWFPQRTRLRSGAAGAGGSAAGGTGAGGTEATSLGGAGVTAGAGGTRGAGAAGPGGARTRAGGTDAGGAGAGGNGAGDSGAGDNGAGGTGAGRVRARGTRAGGAGAGDSRAGGTGVGDTGVGDTGAGGAGVGGSGAGGIGAGGSVQRRPFLILPPPSSLPPPDSVLCQVLNSPLSAPSPYAKQTDSLTECREPASCPALPVCTVRTGHRVPGPRPPPVPDTHIMALRPSSVPLRVPLPSPPASSRANGPDPESDLAHATSPTVPRLLATVVTDPSFESTSAFALVPELVDFGAACHLDHAASLVAESESMDAEMASWKSTSIYVDAVPPSGAKIVDGMWILRVKRPPGSTPVFKGSLHKEIWLRCPPGFTGSFPLGTQLSLRRPVYGLHQAPCEWLDTLRTTLAALRFAPWTADPSLFLRTDTSLPPFYVLVYVKDLVVATADTKALALVKSELQKRHICTDLGPSVLRLQVLLATVQSSAYRSLALSSTFGRVRVTLAHLTADRLGRAASFFSSYLQQHGQLRLAYVANRANTADIFTKALQSGDHQLVTAVVAAVGVVVAILALTVELLSGEFLELQRSQPESLPRQQLREWYASSTGGGGISGSCCAAQLREWYAQRGASRSSAHCLYVIRTCARAGQTCGTVGHTQSRCFSCLSDTWRAEFGAAAELPHWLELLRQGVDIFALDNDAILTAMYALPTRTEGDSSLCVLLDPGIEAAALGAGESALPGTAPAEALHTFTLDSGASRCFFHDNTTLSPLCTCTGQNG